jgi:exocyst complex protein 7
MAADGEERVLITAQQIVRSLGTKDTAMTDDMLQILSKFDHRFSSMNDKTKKLELSISQEVDTTATEEDLQQSKSTRPSSRGAGSSKMIESRLDHAEDVVVRWHMGYSERAKQQRIFECPEEEASTYLEAVDEVQNLLDQLSVQNKEEEQQPATLERAQNVIQLAMERLEEEFRHLLAQNSRSVDPDWLFDSMAVAGSFRSSFDDDHHHTVADAAAASEISSSGEEDAAGDEDEDGLPVARPREIVPTTVELMDPEVVMDLSNIAQRMIAANHQLECCQVYVNCRKAVLEDSMYGLGVEKLSIEEVQKMPWDILEDTIRKWMQAMKVGALVLFASEKLLCEQVSLIISHTNSLSLVASTMQITIFQLTHFQEHPALQPNHCYDTSHRVGCLLILNVCFCNHVSIFRNLSICVHNT